MHERLRQLDEALIDRVFQRILDRVGAAIAVDGCGVARSCTDLSAFAWVLSQAGGFSLSAISASAGAAAFRFAMMLVVLASIMVLRSLFQRVGRGGAGRANPLRDGMHVHRLVCLVWLSGLLVKTAAEASDPAAWGILAMALCTTIGSYFAACSNPPPVRRTARAGDWAGARG